MTGWFPDLYPSNPEPEPSGSGFDPQHVDVVTPSSLTIEDALTLHAIADKYDGYLVHYEAPTSWVHKIYDNRKAPDEAITLQYQFYNKDATVGAVRCFRKFLRRKLPRKSWLVETYPPESMHKPRD